MKELNLNDFSAEAVASVKAVLSMLVGTDEEIRLYEGERYLYTISKADKNKKVPDTQPEADRPDPRPAVAERPIHGDAALGEPHSKVTHG